MLVDTALHAAVSWLKGVLMHKKYAVGKFLYIEGAFNNVRSKAVISALDRFGIGTHFKHLIYLYCLLCDRTVMAELGNACGLRKVNGGFPQQAQS